MSNVNRREFLRTSAVVGAGLGLPGLSRAGGSSEVSCIFLSLVGGPSQLDTWDPKPSAPADVRGPFQSIATRTPGVRFSELFPRMAEMSNRFSVVRTMHHSAPPIHETGLQLMQTGGLSGPDANRPSFGARLSASVRGGTATNVLLPGPLGSLGVNIDHGQSAGPLGPMHEPTTPVIDVTNDAHRERYGRTSFGDDCLRAARLIERGTRYVTVNMFREVYDAVSWDCHAAGGSLLSTLNDYRSIGPMFDTAYTALLTDLGNRGLLESTIVIATGEFGRTPYLNRQGGRDHWANAWTMLLAGATVEPGSVIGSTDRLGGEPNDRPVSADEFGRSLSSLLGISA